MMPGPRPLPQDTNRLLGVHLNHCQNLGLILDKFNPWEQHRNGRWALTMHARQRPHRPVEPLTNEAKGLWLSTTRSAAAGESASLFEVNRIDADLLAAQQQRWRASIGEDAVLFTMETSSRLVVGLGASSTLETSITLHRVYGIPYIPGSALKGLTRFVALISLSQTLGIPVLIPQQYQERQKNNEQTPATPLRKLEQVLEGELDANASQPPALFHDLQQNEVGAEAALRTMRFAQFVEHADVQMFRTIFGTLGEVGRVRFFDAFPSAVPRFEADVMTPHFAKYYQEGAAPADDDSPIPVAFLTVAPGTPFRFGLSPQSRQGDLQADMLRRASDWLQIGLQQAGIGAKTVAGYGRFVPSQRR